jgi:diguanylate cyclase (GGDEF)-like protein
MHTQNFSFVTQLRFFFREYADRANYLALLIAMCAVLTFDLISHLGIAAGVPYGIVVFGSLWVRGCGVTYTIAAMGVIFTLIGYFLSPDGLSPINAVIVNRVLAVLVIFITAMMVIRIKKTEADVSLLRTQCVVDPLTLINNQYAFEQGLAGEFFRAKRYQRNLSIAIIDIDSLKLINVTYGYHRGDEIIKKVAKELETNIRKCDFLYRLEGGKFAILFTETGIAEAKRVGDAICKKVVKNLWLGELNITVSIGIATLEAKDNKKMVCRRAEEALSLSKSSGKNKVSTLPHVIRQDKPHIAAILTRSRSSS